MWPVTKREKKELAIRLRLDERLSLREISNRVSISRSTASLWLRDCPLTQDEQKIKNALRPSGMRRKYKGRGSGAYDSFIAKWLLGQESGNETKSVAVRNYVRQYVWEKYGSQCAECGWAKVNPITGKSPLTIHHIDGNPYNSSPNNLNLLCPNCHSLTDSYGNLNRGKGRRGRHLSQKAEEAGSIPA